MFQYWVSVADGGPALNKRWRLLWAVETAHAIYLLIGIHLPNVLPSYVPMLDQCRRR